MNVTNAKNERKLRGLLMEDEQRQFDALYKLQTLHVYKATLKKAHTGV